MLSDARRGKTTSLGSEPLFSLLMLSRLATDKVLRDTEADWWLSGTRSCWRLRRLQSTTTKMMMTRRRITPPKMTHISSGGPELGSVGPVGRERGDTEKERKEKLRVNLGNRHNDWKHFLSVNALVNRDHNVLTWKASGKASEKML